MTNYIELEKSGRVYRIEKIKGKYCPAIRRRLSKCLSKSLS
ncbi:hypothetical protein HCBAA847_0232 [Helicobacter cinaedi CCUG 18818 = ATCC BAA-847]|uniref:Uncharacterized protein n=1 Tax=Helicobacter cinaedi CCUG 18818 = ATCC BAA-847 TaxID=537971 RepID=A0AAI8QG13_9HELI|nr:hypothetical protein HCBAA847_0232 [Helicobacter cinaedi CCUG 18818 = ATCC BAA-847]